MYNSNNCSIGLERFKSLSLQCMTHVHFDRNLWTIMILFRFCWSAFKPNSVIPCWNGSYLQMSSWVKSSSYYLADKWNVVKKLSSIGHWINLHHSWKWIWDWYLDYTQHSTVQWNTGCVWSITNSFSWSNPSCNTCCCERWASLNGINIYSTMHMSRTSILWQLVYTLSIQNYGIATYM